MHVHVHVHVHDLSSDQPEAGGSDLGSDLPSLHAELVPYPQQRVQWQRADETAPQPHLINQPLQRGPRRLHTCGHAHAHARAHVYPYAPAAWSAEAAHLRACAHAHARARVYP